MKHLFLVISIIVFLTPSLTANVKFDREAETERQRSILAKASSPADSLAPLFNLYDLIVTADRNEIGFQLMHTLFLF